MAATQTRTSLDGRPSSLHSTTTSIAHNPHDDNETYRMMVLRSDKTEEELDRALLNKALELGINVPQDPKTTLDLVTGDVSKINLGTAPATLPGRPARQESRASRSIHAPSDSSIESKGHPKTPSLTATSVTSAPSTNSATSHKSNYVKFKRSLKRLSSIRSKKKPFELQPSTPDLPILPSTNNLLRPDFQARSNTADQVLTVAAPRQESLNPPVSPIPPIRQGPNRKRVISLPYGIPPLSPQNLQPLRSPPPPPMSSPVRQRSPLFQHAPSTPAQPDPDPSALERSLQNPILKKLRTTQLQEQLRFISFRASQSRLLRTARLARKRASLSAYKTLQTQIEARHAEALANLEHRHLSAEVDLNETLQTERQACDLRLRHMQAYCNPRSSVIGMPVRNVTEADLQKLEQQFHVREGIDNLHAGKINVLREKQAKQVERVIDKQEKELQKQTEEFEREENELEEGVRAEEDEMEKVFEDRKTRLVARWGLAEAIERKMLEVETGEAFAELPAIGWGEEGKDGEEVDAEVRRLLAEKRIEIDPDSGIMMMEDGGMVEDEEEESNVI